MFMFVIINWCACSGPPGATYIMVLCRRVLYSSIVYYTIAVLYDFTLHYIMLCYIIVYNAPYYATPSSDRPDSRQPPTKCRGKACSMLSAETEVPNPLYPQAPLLCVFAVRGR